MKFRVQQLSRGFWRERYLLCFQASNGDPWQCREINRSQLDKELTQLGFADYRDSYDIYNKLRFSVRDHGFGEGYVEYDLGAEHGGPMRFDGDPHVDRL